MADFCKQCSAEEGFPNQDMVGLCKEGEVATVICESCGPTKVDHEGKCVYHPKGGSSEDCFARYAAGN